MKVSENWLREWVNPEVDTNTLVEQLTIAGLEVDAVTAAADDFTDVVVADEFSADAEAKTRGAADTGAEEMILDIQAGRTAACFIG